MVKPRYDTERIFSIHATRLHFRALLRGAVFPVSS
ncbi:MAG: hypothetical protein ACEY3D_04925 [Rickettsia sp.]